MSRPSAVATRISQAHPSSLSLAQIRELLAEVERIDELPNAEQYAPIGALLRRLREPGVLQSESDQKDIDEINATYEDLPGAFPPGARGFRFLNIIRNTLEKLEEHAGMNGGRRKRRTRRTRRACSLKNRRKH